MTQYNPKEAIRNGNLQQKQRYYERSTRDAKKRLKVAEELEDEQMITRTKTLISARQKKLREYIKETNKMYGKKYDILTRDYVREQVDTKYLKNDKKIFLKKRLTMNIDKQNVHLQGTMEYNRRVEQGKDPNYKYYGTEPSYFTISVKRLDEIVKENITKF